MPSSTIPPRRPTVLVTAALTAVVSAALLGAADGRAAPAENGVRAENGAPAETGAERARRLFLEIGRAHV